MTGFGASSIKGKNFKVFVSVKSVNSRFMDVKCYTPSFYYSLESEIQKIISHKCARGQFIIRVNRFPETPQPNIILQWDKKQAKKWKNLYQTLTKELNITNSVDATHIINQPGVVNTIKTPISLSVSEATQVKKIFNQAFENCLKERHREGTALKKDILKHIQLIQSDLKKIKNLNSQYQKIKNKAYSLQTKKTKRTDMQPGTEKPDTNEEIVRMDEHLNHFKSISKSPKSIGKRMDFYVQELLREINTIGSKSQTSKLTRYVVEIKANLERVKEQVQNIE